jgi:hypothetical protein
MPPDAGTAANAHTANNASSAANCRARAKRCSKAIGRDIALRYERWASAAVRSRFLLLLLFRYARAARRHKEKAGRKRALHEWGRWGTPRKCCYCSVRLIGTPKAISRGLGGRGVQHEATTAPISCFLFKKLLTSVEIPNALRIASCFKFENNVLKSLTEFRS